MPLFLCNTARSSLRITRRSCYWRRYPSSYLLLAAISTTTTTIPSFWVRAMSTTAASTTVTKPIAAIAQLRSTSNKLQNLRDIAVCARLAKQQGACMLFLPECFGFIGESAQQTLQEAEDPIYLENTGNQINDDYVTNLLKTTISKNNDGSPEEEKEQMIQSNQIIVKSLMCGLRTIAVESGLWISGGGIHVSGAPPDPVTGNSRVYNTHVIINERGVLQCLYRKIHLFDVSIPDKVDLRESKTTAGGTELVTCDSPIGTLGVTICYDLRFPEQFIPLVQKGAQILLVPSAFTVPTGSAHWHTLLRGTGKRPYFVYYNMICCKLLWNLRFFLFLLLFFLQYIQHVPLKVNVM